MKPFPVLALALVSVRLVIAQSESSPLTPTVATGAARKAEAPASAMFYYLGTRLSVTTSTGVIGLAPGTKVEVLKDKGETLLVRAEDLEIDVPRKFLTDDINYIQAAANADYTARLQSAQYVAQQEQIYKQQTIEQNKQREDEANHPKYVQSGGVNFDSWWSNSDANPLNRRPSRSGHYVPKGHIARLDGSDSGMTVSEFLSHMRPPTPEEAIANAVADAQKADEKNQRAIEDLKRHQNALIQSQIEELQRLRGNRFPLTPKERQFQDQADRLRKELQY